MADIISKTLLLAGVATVAAKSTVSYCIRGPRCAKWPLMFQVRRDVMHKVMAAKHKHATDADIEEIDFDLMARVNKQWDIPTSKLPADMGAFRPSSIGVDSISIDPDVFAGAGPAEAGLRALTAQDHVNRDRQIPYEIVAPISMLHGDGDKERAFECTPVDDSENIILYLHGGGYKYGSPASHRGVTGRLSGLSGLRCVSLDYRLAPLNPYPAQLHDAYLAFAYLLQQGFKPQNIVLAGDSAGGNLALVLLLLLRHTGVTRTVCGLVLISPWVDLVSNRSSMSRNARYDYLTGPPLQSPLSLARVFYAPGRRYSQALFDEMSHPLVSPVNGDFADFPPTLIQAGEKEVLVDDITQLHENLLRDNSPERHGSFTYESYADMVHVFHQFTELADGLAAFASAAKFIKGL
ncbi:hypothetical protein GGI20_001676 [Coemansia sp. BCRC 34301]|nr:hypothetical protein GGI20_001676 [Coemansia sp. BCRC 34301]